MLIIFINLIWGFCNLIKPIRLVNSFENSLRWWLRNMCQFILFLSQFYRTVSKASIWAIPLYHNGPFWRFLNLVARFVHFNWLVSFPVHTIKICNNIFPIHAGRHRVVVVIIRVLQHLSCRQPHKLFVWLLINEFILILD